MKRGVRNVAESQNLKGLSRWMTAPSTVGGLLGAIFAIAYGVLTLPLPEGRKITFFILAAIAAGGATLLGDARERRALSSLRTLCESPAGFKPELLLAALRETRGFPLVSFWVNFFAWSGGASTLALVFYPFEGVNLTVFLRIILLGVALGPITSLFVYLLVQRRSRVVLERLMPLARSPEEVVRALPPGREGIRRNLLVFTCVAVLTPTVLVLDITLTRMAVRFDQALSITDPFAQLRTLEALSRSLDFAPYAMAIGVVTMILVMGWLGASLLSKPLEALAAEATRGADGDLSTIRIIAAEDELWAVSSAFTLLQVQIKDNLHELGQAGERLVTSTLALASTTSQQEGSVAEQSAGLTETSATTEELARSAEQIAGNAAQVAATAQMTLSAANAGEKGANQFLAAMRRLKDENGVIADAVLRLNKRVQQIGKVVEFISEIADKTDLLALNAELEGTKAGEAGRGFSLVAAEMRRLAENVLRNTRAIAQLIDEIRDATNSAVMATEAGVKTTDAGAAVAISLSESLGQILALAQKTSEASQAISLATEQQKLGTEELARAMAEILRVTEGHAEATREMAEANGGLSALSAELTSVARQVRTS